MPEMFLEGTALKHLAGIRHGFFTRLGGISEGPFASLNCGFSSGDAPERVEQNRVRALEALGLDPASLTTGRQVHGRNVITATAPAPGRSSTPADALVTRRGGITLGVLSADCAPVLLADPEARVIGAAHAGWRGALGGVLEATVAAMMAQGARPERTSACVGPCIDRTSYEVGPEVRSQFVAKDAGSAAHFEPVAGSDRLRFDLKGYALRRLRRAGIRTAEGLAEDTLADQRRFFSSRRSRKAGEERFGLLLSVIALDA